MQQYTPVIVSVVVSILMGVLLFAAQSGSAPAKSESGLLVFRHSAVFRRLTYLLAIGVTGLIAVGVVLKPPKPSEYGIVLGVFGMFFLLIAPMIWEATRFSIAAGPEGLDCRSPWRGRQFFQWGEVKKISYSGLMGWFVIRAERGGSFRVSLLVPALNSFFEACERELPPEKLAPAKAGYALLGRKLPEVPGSA